MRSPNICAVSMSSFRRNALRIRMAACVGARSGGRLANIYLKSMYKSEGVPWVRIASSVQSRWDDPSLLNAPLAETARWKRCVPRLAPITVLTAKVYYLHGFHLSEGYKSSQVRLGSISTFCNLKQMARIGPRLTSVWSRYADLPFAFMCERREAQTESPGSRVVTKYRM